MLFIFRKLRKSFFLPGKARTYLAYALGEIVLIMVGILLAFTINAWWENRKNWTEERNILLSLNDEFLANKQELVSVVNATEAQENRFVQLQSMSDDEMLALSADEVRLFLRSLNPRRTFDPVRGTVDSLIGAGNLDILSNVELQRAITSFLSTSKDAESSEAIIREFSIKLLEALTKYGGPWSSLRGHPMRAAKSQFLNQPAPETLKKIRSDEYVMGLARQARQSAYVYAGELGYVMEDIEQILDLVNKELETN
ncbi:MAG: DUF6090 family protein [Verrucomicrobia bacterium]|nr:DUF6090 family protein [Verrucomicrobiota bacterium]